MRNARVNRPLRVLWLGPWHSDKALCVRKAVNQAATQWARGLLNSLARSGCQIRVCTHCREQFWPRGEMWPGKQNDFEPSFPVQFVRYANVPGVRDAWLSSAYRRMVRRDVSVFNPDVVFSYNLEPYHCAVSDMLNELGIKWVPIILDQDDPEPDEWRTFRKQSRGASALVFLSYWGYQHCPIELPLLHLDGGVEQWRGEEGERHSAKTVVYSGKYDDRYGGLDKLFEIFAAVKMPDCEFFLTGKDSKNRLAPYLRKEPRAKYCGFLHREALHDIHSRAAVFVNPRPPDIGDNRMIFPSKLLHYLSYGKPIVSTWTEGLTPEYRDLLMVPVDDATGAYAGLIEHAVVMDQPSRLLLYKKVRTWVSATHMWEIQSRRLMTWLFEQVGLKPSI